MHFIKIKHNDDCFLYLMEPKEANTLDFETLKKFVVKRCFKNKNEKAIPFFRIQYSLLNDRINLDSDDDLNVMKLYLRKQIREQEDFMLSLYVVEEKKLEQIKNKLKQVELPTKEEMKAQSEEVVKSLEELKNQIAEVMKASERFFQRPGEEEKNQEEERKVDFGNIYELQQRTGMQKEVLEAQTMEILRGLERFFQRPVEKSEIEKEEEGENEEEKNEEISNSVEKVDFGNFFEFMAKAKAEIQSDEIQKQLAEAMKQVETYFIKNEEEQQQQPQQKQPQQNQQQQQPQQNQQPQQPKIYKARFVKDVTLEDGTEVAPGEKVLKTFRVRNEGMDSWPNGVSLNFIEGDQLTEETSIPVEPTQPNKEVDISLELNAPQSAGRYKSSFRLTTPEGKRFGHKMWVDIQVVNNNNNNNNNDNENNLEEWVSVQSSQQQVQSSSPVQKLPQGSNEWSEMLRKLDNMGFRDRNKNMRLLVKYNGDVLRLIEALLAGEQ